MLILPRFSVAIRPALLAAALLAPTARLRPQHVAPARASDTPLVPLTTRWPSRQGIAVLAPHQVNPMAIEATSDGWVVLRPFTRPEMRDDIPTSRLHAAPEDVERWVTASRRLLARLADSSRTGAQGELLTLGRGRLRLAPHYWVDKNKEVSMQLVTCDAVWNSLSFTRTELETLTSALERAAAIARQRAESPKPPTLDRPYYASEVSCAARRDRESPPPSFPSNVPASQRRYTEVGVRFIVDTAGFVESGSVALLPGAPPAVARAARMIVEHWRYRPADWSGLPVRQIVTSVVAFDPEEEATRNDSARVALEQSERKLDSAVRAFRREPVTIVRRDGAWVHVRSGRWRSDGLFDGYQEWFQPDSVDAWVARVREVMAADSAQPKRTWAPRDIASLIIGPPRDGNRLRAELGWNSNTQRIRFITQMIGCGGAQVLPALLDRRQLEQLSAAARGARLDHASPSSIGRTYGRGEVACAPYLPPIGLGRPELPGVSRYPRAPYPDQLSREYVRAEVLSSFVVDTTGTAIASTLQIAPGADPRAAGVLRQWIDRIRFQPASRGGQRVPTRVVRTWLFEPPATCADEHDGVDCARSYGKEP